MVMWHWLQLVEITYQFTSGSCRKFEKNCSKIQSSMVSIKEDLVSCKFMLFFSPFIAVSPAVSTEEFVNDLRFFSKAAENPAAQTYWERQQYESAASNQFQRYSTSDSTNYEPRRLVNQNIYFKLHFPQVECKCILFYKIIFISLWLLSEYWWSK